MLAGAGTLIAAHRRAGSSPDGAGADERSMERSIARVSLLAVSIAALVPAQVAAGPSPVEAHVQPRSAPQTVNVAVGEFYFAPGSVQLARGGTVVFDFTGSETHTATDSSGLGLYDTGNVGPGGDSFEFTFPAAGVYPFVCTPHAGMGGRVSVPVRVTPRSGGPGPAFTVVWAASRATDGRVYDVQVRRPGARWDAWRRGVTRASGTFLAKAGEGVYRFRARMRDPGLGASSRWSPAARLRVR
jgi:plastocyanin